MEGGVQTRLEGVEEGLLDEHEVLLGHRDVVHPRQEARGGRLEVVEHAGRGAAVLVGACHHHLHLSHRTRACRVAAAGAAVHSCA